MSGGLAPNEVALADINGKFDARPFYKGVLVRTATLRPTTQLSPSTVVAIAFDKVQAARSVHDYGSLLLNEKWYSIEEFREWVSQLTKNSKLRIDGDATIEAKGDWISYENSPGVFVPSDNSLAIEGWPTNLYRYLLQQQNYPGFALKPKASLPLFPNGTEAMQWWFDISAIARSDLFGKVSILLPNYAVRIREVEIGFPV